MDQFDAFDVAHAEFERRLRLVRDDQWTDPTPCAEWTVHDLVNHVVSSARTYALMVNGCSREQASGDLGAEALGDDPLAAFLHHDEALHDAFRQPGALERVCMHPMGDVSGALLLRARGTEGAIHTWDLARAIGADEHLDPRLVDHALRHLIDMSEVFVEAGAIAPPTGPTDESVEPQTRMLRLAGRNP